MKSFNPTTIKELREQHGLTQESFAERIGNSVKRQHVSAWEKGVQKPSVSSLAAIASAFGVKIDYFFIESHSTTINTKD